MNIRKIITRAQELGRTCSKIHDENFKAASKVISKLFPTTVAEDKADETISKLSLFVALYYVGKAIAFCPKHKKDQEIAKSYTALKNDFITTIGGIEESVKFLVKNRTSIDKVADPKALAILVKQVFKLIYLSPNDIETSEEEKQAKADALVDLFREQNRLNQKIDNFKLMVLLLGHRTNPKAVDCLNGIFRLRGTSVATIAQSSYMAACLLLQKKTRVSKSLTAYEVAKIIDKHLDVISASFDKIISKKHKTRSRIQLIPMIVANTHCYIHEAFLKATQFQTLSALLQDRDAALILNRRERLKFMIQKEKEAADRARAQDEAATYAAVTQAVMVPEVRGEVLDLMSQRVVMVDGGWDAEEAPRVVEEEEKPLPPSKPPVKLAGHRNNVWQQQEFVRAANIDSDDDNDELNAGMGGQVIDCHNDNDERRHSSSAIPIIMKK